MKITRKNRKIIRLTNAIDGAASSLLWGKKRFKRYKGVAGKGGKTTNFGGGVDA